MIRPLKSYARVFRHFGTIQVAPAETAPQLECVAEEQTGVIIFRQAAGPAWACLAGAGACAIVVARSLINATSTMVITTHDIASVLAAVAAVAHLFSSMFPAGLR